MNAENIYKAIANRTGTRQQAVENWCNKHKIDPYLNGGAITSNVKEFISCLVNDELTREFECKLNLKN